MPPKAKKSTATPARNEAATPTVSTMTSASDATSTTAVNTVADTPTAMALTPGAADTAQPVSTETLPSFTINSGLPYFHYLTLHLMEIAVNAYVNSSSMFVTDRVLRTEKVKLAQKILEEANQLQCKNFDELSQHITTMIEAKYIQAGQLSQEHNVALGRFGQLTQVLQTILMHVRTQCNAHQLFSLMDQKIASIKNDARLLFIDGLLRHYFLPHLIFVEDSSVQKLLDRYLGDNGEKFKRKSDKVLAYIQDNLSEVTCTTPLAWSKQIERMLKSLKEENRQIEADFSSRTQQTVAVLGSAASYVGSLWKSSSTEVKSQLNPLEKVIDTLLSEVHTLQETLQPKVAMMQQSR